MPSPNNVERSGQTDPTMLGYTLAIIMEQKECWELFQLCATPPKNTQQHATGVQMGTTGHIQQCFKLLANNLVSICTCWAVDIAMEVSSSLCDNSAT